MRWRLGRSRSARRTLIAGHGLVEVEMHSFEAQRFHKLLKNAMKNSQNIHQNLKCLLPRSAKSFETRASQEQQHEAARMAAEAPSATFQARRLHG